jgi:copper oxidase (laccase) domain-containing protein
MMHAGWRGASAGILPDGLAELQRLFGVQPESIRVYLGPSICGTCYEVGTEVLEAFGRPSVGRALLDLRSELQRQAEEAGVPPASITRSEWCTRCGSVRLHSHRASGPEAGRMAAFVGIQPAREQGDEGRGTGIARLSARP